MGELRANAAVALEKQPHNYKFTLCRNWLQADTCTHGDRCSFAHGVQDLRWVA